MKKLLYITFAAMLAATACKKENIDPKSKDEVTRDSLARLHKKKLRM